MVEMSSHVADSAFQHCPLGAAGLVARTQGSAWELAVTSPDEKCRALAPLAGENCVMTMLMVFRVRASRVLGMAPAR